MSKHANHVQVEAASLASGTPGARVISTSPGIVLPPLARDEMSGPDAAGYQAMLNITGTDRAWTASSSLASKAVRSHPIELSAAPLPDSRTLSKHGNGSLGSPAVSGGRCSFTAPGKMPAKGGRTATPKASTATSTAIRDRRRTGPPPSRSCAGWIGAVPGVITPSAVTIFGGTARPKRKGQSIPVADLRGISVGDELARAADRSGTDRRSGALTTRRSRVSHCEDNERASAADMPSPGTRGPLCCLGRTIVGRSIAGVVTCRAGPRALIGPTMMA
jgi:hypothetical protein